MSASDEEMLKDLGRRARARADEAARIEASLRAEPRATSSVDAILAAIGPVASPASSPASRAKKGARVTFARNGAWIAGATSLAAAAAVALVVGLGHRDGAALGPYVVSVSGHVEIARAAHDGTFDALEARPGSIQEVVVRPREATPGPLAARVVVMRGDVGTVSDVAPEISDRGAVRFEMPGEALAGASEVRVVIASPDALGAAAAEAARAPLASPPASRSDAVFVRVPVEPAGEKK
jgi:hypothetical protein